MAPHTRVKLIHYRAELICKSSALSEKCGSCVSGKVVNRLVTVIYISYYTSTLSLHTCSSYIFSQGDGSANIVEKCCVHTCSINVLFYPSGLE